MTTVDVEIRRLSELSRQELIKVWTAAFGRSPPKGLSRRILEYAAAYHLQARAYGGLSNITRRRLREGRMGREDKVASVKAARIKPGSRLIREWHGRSHVVDVTETGFLYADTHYGSLSEIARIITGAKWSGPRFFGT